MGYALSLLLFLSVSLTAFAGVEQLSEREFQQLAEELAPKVNLFREAWERDPEAVFYGGTSRDYLYWLKGKFREAGSPSVAKKIADNLRALPAIDVRDFIIGESDVDIVSKDRLLIDANQFGVRKIDALPPDIFDPLSELGRNELDQGYIPAEKIRISRKGIGLPGQLGNGLHEIYSGKLSVHYPDPEKFLTTKYAKSGENHQVLLALRYLRLQAINYFQTHGKGISEREVMMAGFDSDSLAQTKKVIHGVLDGKTLKPHLEKNRFRSWINGTIQKAFRSYTNPDAALYYAKEFGVDQLSSTYGDQIETIYQYVFGRYRDANITGNNLEEYGVDKAKFYLNRDAVFPDGHLYHGTRNEGAFRSILFQGILPSSGGSGGDGLYGVAETNRGFAETWGGSSDRLVRLPVQPGAKIVDITQGEGERIWKKFPHQTSDAFSAFAEAFDVDILRYPYSTEAFVVKNSAALGKAEGVNRQLRTLASFLEEAPLVPLERLFEQITLNNFSQTEVNALISATKRSESDLLKAADHYFRHTKNIAVESAKLVFDSDFGKRNEDRLVPLLQLSDPDNFRYRLLILDLKGRAASAAIVRDFNKLGKNLQTPTLKYLQGRPDWDEIEKLYAKIQSEWRVSSENNFLPHEIYIAHLERKPLDVQIPAIDALLEKKDPRAMWVLSESYFNRPSAEKVPLMKKLLGYVDKNSPQYDYMPSVIEKWHAYPEVAEIYLSDPNENIKKRFFAEITKRPEWLRQYPTMNKFLRWHLKNRADLAESMKSEDFSRRAAFWEKMMEGKKLMGNYFADEFTLGHAYLALDDIWKQDPDYLVGQIPRLTGDRRIAYYAAHPDIGKYPQLVEALIGNLRSVMAQTRDHSELLSRPPWRGNAAMMEALFPIAAKGYTTNQQTYHFQVMAELFKDPIWADRPDLFFEFIRQAPKANVLPVLNEPHWQNHPALQAAKKNGAFDYFRLKNLALRHTPTTRTRLQGLRSHCMDAFSAIAAPFRP